MSALGPGEEWLINVLDTIDEGIHAVDLSGVTIVYNAAAGRMDGLSVHDVLGKHVLSAFPSLVAETSTLLQVLSTGHAMYNRPQTYTNYFGAKVHTVNTTLPILSGGRIVGALEIAKDLTQVKRLSEQVISLQAQVMGNSKRTKVTDHQPASQALYRLGQLLSTDSRVIDIKQKAERAARTLSPILVYGETGTGKELLVQGIHNASARSAQPFLAQNCAALPSSLLEGILFGTVRGSFTGAEDRPGLFELANHGTLFLDEIQSMPAELQAKMLRVLQEGELMRLGDTKIRRLDVRVIVAMNERPEHAVEIGTLRKDLYYRVNVVRFDLPPLRERKVDIDLLIEHFVNKWNGQFGLHVTDVSPMVRALFHAYPWPGNVRELENAIEAAMNQISEGLIPIDAIPLHIREWQPRSTAGGTDGANLRADGFRVGVEGVGVEGVGVEGVGVEGVGVEGRALVGLVSAEKSASSFVAGRGTVSDEHQFGPEREWADVLVAEGMNELWASVSDDSQHAVHWRAVQQAFERMVLARALATSDGNVKQAALRLGIPRQTLQYRMQQLGL